MRLPDLLSLPISALWQQKARTLLTTLGVIFGSFVLAASLSIGQGVQDTIARESGRRETLRMINVYPEWQPDEDTLAKADVKVEGKMSDARRERIRHALAEYQARFSAEGPRAKLTPDKLDSLARLAHVESVIPVVSLYGYAVYKNESGPANAASVRIEGENLAARLVAGRSLASPSEKAALVSEFLLYRLGVVDDQDIPNVVGHKIRLEFRDYANPAGIQVYLAKPDGGEVTRDEAAAIEKIQARLPEALEALELSAQEADLLRAAIRPSESSTPQQRVQAAEYEIAGVVRLRTAEERAQPWDPLQTDSDVALPYQTAAELLLSMPGRSKLGFDQAVVIVDREEHVEEVFQAATDMGLRAHAVLEFIKQQQLMYLLIFGGMTCVAAVALLVAALGIANTMLMSVLERTREIGIMKAVGASNRQLQFVFLVEGALVGFIGGGIGLFSAWAASLPGDAWVRSIVTRDLNITLKQPIFVFPPWVIVAVIAFAIIVTTLAAVYPARRAARVDPIAALRHE